MSILQRATNLLRSPGTLLYGGVGRLAPGRLWQRYARLCRAAGIDDLYLILSFDCDTREDIEAAEAVFERLGDLGVSAVFAVPGELLQQGEATYRRILEAGGEFINHGYRDHTYYDDKLGHYASRYFYDQMSPEVVRDDVVRGDRNLREVLGVQARGFRSPHFGTYQRPAQLRYLHGILAELGYAFSTSTSPFQAFRRGPLFRDFGVPELPVSGMGTRPMRILDTWGCFEAPHRRFTPQDFFAEGLAAAEQFARIGVGIMNYYGDPCHIRDQPLFYQTVTRWAEVARPVTYNQLLDRFS